MTKSTGIARPADQNRGGCYAHATNHKTLLVVPGGGDRSEIGVQEEREPAVEIEGGCVSGHSGDEAPARWLSGTTSKYLRRATVYAPSQPPSPPPLQKFQQNLALQILAKFAGSSEN
ncbi:hypothetical protein MTO96_047837 [Rhipicephalus appendiculatus]